MLVTPAPGAQASRVLELLFHAKTTIGNHYAVMAMRTAPFRFLGGVASRCSLGLRSAAASRGRR